MKKATSWHKVAWRNVQSPFVSRIVDELNARKVEPREIIAQDIGKYREFIDSQVGWGALDNKTKTAGMPWRCTLSRSSPSPDTHPGLQDWDTREIFRDVYTPQQMVGTIGPQSKKIGLYNVGVGRAEDQLVGALSYSLEPKLSLDFIAVAPSHRRQKIATFMVLGMLMHMQSVHPELECFANIPCGANLDRPWLAGWLEHLEFERPEEYLPTLEGLRMVNKKIVEDHQQFFSAFIDEQEEYSQLQE